MAIPIEESLQLPLLRVIKDAGGELTLREAVERVAIKTVIWTGILIFKPRSMGQTKTGRIRATIW